MRYPPPMPKKVRTSRAEEVALAARIAQGDLLARDELVTRNLPFVHYLASYRASRSGHDCDDLVQAGSVGLLEAATRYRPERGTRFGTFAAFWIKKAMTACLHRHHLMDTPYRHRRKFAGAPPTLSLDLPHGDNGDRLCDHLGDKVASAATPRALAALDAHRLLVRTGLTEREARILHARFWEERPLREIGRDLGVSRERVRQLQRLALTKLSQTLTSTPAKPPPPLG